MCQYKSISVSVSAECVGCGYEAPDDFTEKFTVFLKELHKFFLKCVIEPETEIDLHWEISNYRKLVKSHALVTVQYKIHLTNPVKV